MTTPYQLLTLCTRLHLTPAESTRLQQAFAGFQEWDELVSLAEAHRLAPLLYTHLRDAAVPIPPAARLALQGLYLRHRQANADRFAVLAEILHHLQAANIPVLLLKGAALAPLVYKDLALRPMGDLDILLPPEHAEAAFDLLCRHNFQPIQVGVHLPDDHRHLQVLGRQMETMLVSVEIHRWLAGTLLSGEAVPYEVLQAGHVPVPLAGAAAFTLAPAVMLHHLHNHMVSETMRLIRVVDVVAVAEYFVDEIDWSQLRRDNPALVAALSLLHFVCPLSETLRARLGGPVGTPPDGCDEPLLDWPPIPRRQWAGMRRREILRRTFFPTAFTLRLYYGVANGRSLFWHRWFIHPVTIVRRWWQRRQPHQL